MTQHGGNSVPFQAPSEGRKTPTTKSNGMWKKSYASSESCQLEVYGLPDRPSEKAKFRPIMASFVPRPDVQLKRTSTGGGLSTRAASQHTHTARLGAGRRLHRSAPHGG